MKQNLKVKYHNSINQLDVKGWDNLELDMFFAILAKAKQQGTSLITITRDDLFKLLDVDSKAGIKANAGRVTERMKAIVDKYSHLSYVESVREKDKNRYEVFNMFQRIAYEWSDDYSEMCLYIQLSQDYEYIVNKFTQEFTVFELQEFVKLRSVYSKLAFKLMKQWRVQGHTKDYSLKEFKELMGLSDTYPTKEIKRHIIKPITEELSPVFDGFEVIPLYKGQRITGYRFRFTPEKTNGPYEPGKPKTKRKSQKASLPEWYYQEDPGHATEAQAEELKALLERPADPKPEADETDSNDDDIFDPFEGI